MSDYHKSGRRYAKLYENREATGDYVVVAFRGDRDRKDATDSCYQALDRALIDVSAKELTTAEKKQCEDSGYVFDWWGTKEFFETDLFPEGLKINHCNRCGQNRVYIEKGCKFCVERPRVLSLWVNPSPNITPEYEIDYKDEKYTEIIDIRENKDFHSELSAILKHLEMAEKETLEKDTVLIISQHNMGSKGGYFYNWFQRPTSETKLYEIRWYYKTKGGAYKNYIKTPTPPHWTDWETPTQ